MEVSFDGASMHTMIIVGAFGLGYLLSILTKTGYRKLDLYDLGLLSSVAVLPVMFVFFPGFAEWVGSVVGVGFPFVVMFGALFASLFVLVHRFTLQLHDMQMTKVALIQEIGLLRCELDEHRAPRSK
jgi:hypothetical protein